MKGQYININEKLINACKKGNSKAQIELYKQYAKAMYNASFRILKDSAEAEDAMQEGFLKAFQNIETYSGTVSFGAWLKKIIVNTSLDLLRKRKIEFEDIDTVYLGDHYEDSYEDENEIEYKVEQVRHAIFSLPDGYRVVMTLYLLEGYDHEEIAEILGITASTSRSQLARARKKLIELLNDNNKME